MTEKLAETAGVGARSVSRAIKVREEGIPEVNEADADSAATATTIAEDQITGIPVIFW